MPQALAATKSATAIIPRRASRARAPEGGNLGYPQDHRCTVAYPCFPFHETSLMGSSFSNVLGRLFVVVAGGGVAALKIELRDLDGGKSDERSKYRCEMNYGLSPLPTYRGNNALLCREVSYSSRCKEPSDASSFCSDCVL